MTTTNEQLSTPGQEGFENAENLNEIRTAASESAEELDAEELDAEELDEEADLDETEATDEA